MSVHCYRFAPPASSSTGRVTWTWVVSAVPTTTASGAIGVIAIAASYAALDLTGRVTAAGGRIRLAWLSGGAAAMAIGVWAMHLKGMLAFHLPVGVERRMNL